MEKYCIETKSVGHRRAVLLALGGLGLKFAKMEINLKSVDEIERQYKLEGFPFIRMKPNGDLDGYATRAGFVVLFLDEFIQKFLGQKKIKVPLNGEYAAEVWPDKITVGCQTFSVDIVAKLAQALEEVSKSTK